MIFISIKHFKDYHVHQEFSNKDIKSIDQNYPFIHFRQPESLIYHLFSDVIIGQFYNPWRYIK